ncbi:hypothetical protein MX569_13855, partial [Anoxybacillus kestanbolensis]|uniref:hypothetical protein n=1 Tax=Anoxybacillus kestanbolensis TaxID=227476 RepID=UPI00208DDB64
MFQPNYANPSIYEYQRLLDEEIWLILVEEYCKAYGLHDDASWIRHMKKFVTIRRKCMKAALQQKEKTASS